MPKGQEYHPRRVLLFENDPTQFEGGKERLMVHKAVETIGDPSKETKDTIREHHFFPQEEEEGEEEEQEEDPDYVQGTG